jgi:hypothetical protein
MLSKLSVRVAECYEHAGECAQHAKNTDDSKLRDEFLNLERSWIKLARSIESSERFALFVQANKKTG